MDKPNIFRKFRDIGAAATKEFLGLTNVSTSSLVSSSYRGGDAPFGKSGWLFDRPNGIDIHFSYDGLEDVVKAYEYCPPVFSIINKQAYAFTNGKVVIANKQGKAKGKDSQSPWAVKVRGLMTRPNPLQNWKQFEAQVAVFMRLFGYCIILPIKPIGFPNSDATALWIIPPYLCKIKYSKKTFFTLKNGWIESITIKYGDETSVITDMNRLMFLRDITPGFDNPVLPGSPIKPIQKNINNLIGIYDSKGMLINYRGALGILSPELDPAGSITMDPKEKEDIETDMMRLGLRTGQTKIIIANSAMNWQQIGISYKELMLTEWAQDDTQVVCDALNYPFELMANGRPSSMNGTEVEAYKKQLYIDFVIPFADMIYEQLAEEFDAEANGCTITKDFNHLAVLQEDSLKSSQSRKFRNDALLIEFYNNQITLNRWNELNGEDPVSGEHGDMYYSDLVKIGMTFGSPKGITPAADNAAQADGAGADTPPGTKMVKCPQCSAQTKDVEVAMGYIKCDHCDATFKSS